MAKRTWLRWTMVSMIAAGCGSDEPSDNGGDTYTLSGRVLAADDDRPLAGVMVSSALGQRATTDTSGRFMVGGVRGGSFVRVESSSHAPVSKPSWGRGETTMVMKGYDGIGSITASLGGSVRGTSERRAAVRFAAAALSGADSTEVVIAAPDPRRASAMRAITGNFAAEQSGTIGKLSVVSPLFVNTSGATRGVLAAQARVEVDFPAWVEGRTAALALFAFNETSGSWTSAGTVTPATNESGQAVYRGFSDRLGWLAVGEFYTDLACVKACAQDGSGAPVIDAEAAATGVDHFSQTLGETDSKGCFELQVRANAQVKVEVRTSAGELLSATASTGPANSGACIDAGVLRGAVTPTPVRDAGTDAGDAGTMQSTLDPALERYVDRFLECGLQSERLLRWELSQANTAYPAPIVTPANWLANDARELREYADCVVALPCADFVSDYCGDNTPAQERCDELDDAEQFSCADGITPSYASACDGYPDCADGSDETSAACAQRPHYKCDERDLLLPRGAYCDGEADCPLLDDEKGCFSCGGTEVIQPWGRCDGWSECENGADEQGCGANVPDFDNEDYVCPDGSPADYGGDDDDDVVVVTPAGDGGLPKGKSLVAPRATPARHAVLRR